MSIDESHTGSGKRVDASIVNNHHEQIRVKERLLLKAKSSSYLVRRVIGQVRGVGVAERREVVTAMSSGSAAV